MRAKGPRCEDCARGCGRSSCDRIMPRRLGGSALAVRVVLSLLSLSLSLLRHDKTGSEHKLTSSLPEHKHTHTYLHLNQRSPTCSCRTSRTPSSTCASRCKTASTASTSRTCASCCRTAAPSGRVCLLLRPRHRGLLALLSRLRRTRTRTRTRTRRTRSSDPVRLKSPSRTPSSPRCHRLLPLLLLLLLLRRTK